MTLPPPHTPKSTLSKLYSSFRNKVIRKFRNFFPIFITRSPFRCTSSTALLKIFEQFTLDINPFSCQLHEKVEWLFLLLFENERDINKNVGQ